MSWDSLFHSYIRTPNLAFMHINILLNIPLKEIIYAKNPDDINEYVSKKNILGEKNTSHIKS